MPHKQLSSAELRKAMAFAALGFFLWTLSDTAIRFANDAPTASIAFWASTSSVIFALIASPWLGGIKKTMTQPKLPLRLFRGLVLSFAAGLSFIAFSELEMATAYALIFVAPMMAKILSVFINMEMIRLRSWLISALGFIGVLIVMRPGMVPVSIGAMAALGLTVFWSLGQILGRKIGSENQTQLSLTLFHFSFVMIGTAAYIILFESAALFILPLKHMLICAFIGIFGVLGSMSAGRSFAVAPAAYIAPIHYSQIIWGTLWGALLFGEYPDIWTIAGGAVIISAGLLLVKFSRPV